MESTLIGGRVAVADGSADDFAAWVEPHVPAMARFASRLVPGADQGRRGRLRSRPTLPVPDPGLHVELAPADLDLERAIATLSPRQRTAVDLYYFVDLDVATIAAVMGCAPGTVKATLSQARARLHELLGGDHA